MHSYSAALYRNTYAILIPSHSAPKRECTPKGSKPLASALVQKHRCDSNSKSFIVVVVLTLNHRYNAVRGHRTDPKNSGAEDYPRKKTK